MRRAGRRWGCTTSSNNRLVNVQVNGDVGIGGGSLRIGGTFGSSGVISLASGRAAGDLKAAPDDLIGDVPELAGGTMGFYGQSGAQTLTISSGVVVHGYGTLGQYVFVGGSGGQNKVTQGEISGDVTGHTLSTSSRHGLYELRHAHGHGGRGSEHRCDCRQPLLR